MFLWNERDELERQIARNKPDPLNAARAHLLILMMYRHGLRVSEAINIGLEDVDLAQARLWVRRNQGGRSGEHPLPADELRAIEQLVPESYLAAYAERTEWDPVYGPRRVDFFTLGGLPAHEAAAATPNWPDWFYHYPRFHLFVTGRNNRMSRQDVFKIVREAAARAGLENVNARMLRPSCGHALAAKGVDLATIQEYLGLCDPRHVKRFAQSGGRRFEGLWD